MSQRVPGAPLPGGDGDLDARAQVSASDLEEAKRWARRADRDWFHLTFDSWDARLAAYRRGSRVFTREETRNLLDRAIASGRREARVLGEQLRAREIPLGDWQVGMERLVKSTQINAIAGSRGGWHRWTSDDYARAANAIRRQHKYLQNFAEEVKSGKQRLDGTLVRRAGMYPEAARATYENDSREHSPPPEYSQERRVRHASDSCAGCVEEAARGWVERGTLSPIGSKECLTMCKCRFAYRNPTTGKVIG